MADDGRTRPCTECGWPALVGTRRCPYCRVRMPRERRETLVLWWSPPLRWIVLTWAAAMASTAVLALLAMGPLLALAVCLIATTPLLFALALRHRSLARIRALGRGRRASRRALGLPPDSTAPERRGSSSDAGLR